MTSRSCALPRTLLTTLLAMTWLTSAQARNIGCQELTYPDRARVVVVADNMLFNGVPMAAWELHWEGSAEMLRDHYRRYWQARGNRVTETRIGAWQTVATGEGQCFYTVQTRSTTDGGSHALIGVTRIPDSVTNTSLGSGFPKLSGSQVLNDLRHRDGIRNARTLLLANQFSIQANANYYRSAMQGSGWQAMLDRSVDTTKGAARVMIWRRGTEEASMTIGPGIQGSTVNVNIVDKP